MLELSPLETAAKAPASSMPASRRVSWSKPMPVTRRPPNEEPRRRKEVGSRSITATVCPCCSRVWASAEPTRPQPMMTMCIASHRASCGPAGLGGCRHVSLSARLATRRGQCPGRRGTSCRCAPRPTPLGPRKPGSPVRTVRPDVRPQRIGKPPGPAGAVSPPGRRPPAADAADAGAGQETEADEGGGAADQLCAQVHGTSRGGDGRKAAGLAGVSSHIGMRTPSPAESPAGEPSEFTRRADGGRIGGGGWAGARSNAYDPLLCPN